MCRNFIELRKYIDVGRDRSPDHVYLVNHEGEFHFNVSGRVGFPFFGELILDFLNRTTGGKVRLPLVPGDPFYTREGTMANAIHFYEKRASVENLADVGITTGSDYRS